MLPIYGISALAGLGYYLNQDKRIKKEKVEKDLIPEHEIPSNDNIYDSRYLEKTWGDQFKRNTQNHLDSRDPRNTNIISNVFKDRPDYKVEQERQQYNGIKAIQKETEQLSSKTLKGTSALPTSSQTVLQNSTELPNSQTLVDYGVQEYNEKQRRMYPLNYKQDDSTGGWSPITNQKIGFNTEQEHSTRIVKNPTVYEYGHNNMEPFFGSSIKQNLDPYANRSRLEAFTGTEPVFKHKKEAKRFFPLERNPYVNGIPVQKNRELDRYKPALDKNNVIPFEQIKVAPGLNKEMSDPTSNIGFHETYRPRYKTVNELRVNPKLSYRGRTAGEKFYTAPGREMEKPVISRQPVDVSYSMFDEDKGSSSTGKARGAVHNALAGTGGKQQVLDQKSIVLKLAERDQYGHRIAPLHGHGDGSHTARKQKTGLFDTAKQTTKTTTEYNVYQRINPSAGDNDKQGSWQPFDEAKHITKESTEKNPYERINPGAGDNNKKGIAYDSEKWKAKNTIKQQTENNIYSHINAAQQGSDKHKVYDPENWKARTTIRETTGDRYYAPIVAASNRPQGVTHIFDGAKTTIKEQTYVEDYMGIHGNGDGANNQTSRENMYNAEINALKELTLPGRMPTQQGVKVIPDKNRYNIEIKKQQFDTYDKTKRITKTWNPTKSLQPEQTTQKPRYCDTDLLKDRINPYVVESFTKNPYTQSLQSFIYPQNPAHPTSNIKPVVKSKYISQPNRFP